MTPPNTRRPAVERAFKALTGEKPRQLGRQPIKSEETDLVLLRGASCSARSFKGDSSPRWLGWGGGPVYWSSGYVFRPLLLASRHFFMPLLSTLSRCTHSPSRSLLP